MNFSDFEKQARLYVVGALDEEEAMAFAQARREFGELAEEFIERCQTLNAVFALSLRPEPPHADAKERLMALIGNSRRGWPRA